MATVIVTYTDGRVVETQTTPKGEIETERKFGIALSESRSNEQAYYLTWASMFHGGQEVAAFDLWVEQIVSMEMKKEEDGGKKTIADPTRLAPRRTASSA